MSYYSSAFPMNTGPGPAPDFGQNTLLSGETSGQPIITPPNRKPTGRRHKVIVINSADRNRVIYPDAQSWSYRLDELYRDVISIQMIASIFPNHHPNISTNRRWFEIIMKPSNHDEIVYDCLISPGYYDPDGSTLESAIQNVLDTIPSTIEGEGTDGTDVLLGNITVTLDDVSKCLTFTGDTDTPPFTLRTGNSSTGQYNTHTNGIGNMGRRMGFAPGEFDSSLENSVQTLHASYPINLASTPCYILRISQLDNVRSNSFHIEKAFAVIPLDGQSSPSARSSQNKFDIDTTDMFIRHFNPSRPFQQFVISIYDIDNDPVSFVTHDYQLYFKIETVRDPLKYSA